MKEEFSFKKCEVNTSFNGECCCNCRNHYKDYHHCTTTPDKKEGECVCSKEKGWICFARFDNKTEPRVYSGWPEHGYCEMWQPKL